MEEPHGIPDMRGCLGASLHACHRKFVSGTGVPDCGRDAHVGKLRDELWHAWHLRRKRRIEDMAACGILIFPEKGRICLVHEQMLRHGSFVLGRQARPFEMDADQCRPVIGSAFDDLFRGSDASERLLRRIGQDRAEPGSHALRGEEATDLAESCCTPLVHIDPRGTMCMDIHEAGQRIEPRGIDDRKLAWIVESGTDTRDESLLDCDVSTEDRAAAHDAGTLYVDGISHGFPPSRRARVPRHSHR